MLDQERAQRARQYENLHNWLFLGDNLLFWLVAGLCLLGGKEALAIRAWHWLSESLGGGFLIPTLAFICLWHVLYALLTFPYDLYKDFLLEKRFDLCNQKLSGYLIDWFKSLLLGTLLYAVCLGFCYCAMKSLGSLWFLAAAAGWIFLQVFLGVIFPVALLPLFYKTAPLDGHPAAEGLLELTKKAGLKITGLYRFDMSEKSKKANAMLCGLFKTRRVILSDTLLSYPPEEIVAVMAHEVGHYKRAHIWKLSALYTVTILLGLFLVSLALERYCSLSGLKLWEAGSLPFFLLAFSIFQLLMMPLTNGFSRRCEREADLFALEAMGEGQTFARALERLADENLAVLEANPAIEFFLYSHPALGKRIEMAKKWSAK